MFGRRFSLAAVAAAMLMVCGAAGQEIPAAPVPPQILSAKRVFISNGGSEATFETVNGYSGGPNRVYNQFYAAMKSWGRFDLVAAPADADLIVEIAQRDLPINALPRPRLLVRMIDPKTGILLWTFTGYVQVAGRMKNRDKNYDQGMTALMNDIKGVVAPAVAKP